MSKLTEEDLALLTEEERKGYLEEEEEDESDDPEGGAGNAAGDAGADSQAGKADQPGNDAGAGSEGADGANGEPAPGAVADPAGKPAEEKKEPEPNTAFTPPPQPLFNAEVPADIEAKRTALDTQESSLDEQYDQGDITFAEHKKALRELNSQRQKLDRAELKAELVSESQQSQMSQNWQNAQATFFASHPEFNTANDGQFAALDYFVRQETKPVQDKGGAIGLPELERAYAKYKQSFGIADTAQQKQEPPPKAEKKANVVPPNLGKIPAAAANPTDDGKYAHLDRLMDSDPLAFEEALAGMTPAQRDEYMRAG